jgi:hypothetical protein
LRREKRPTPSQPEQPAYHVPEYLQGAGVTVVPIPVYYPEVTHILGEPVFRSVAAAAASAPTQPLDVVCVFRRSSDVAAHVEDILAVRAQHARQARARSVCARKR